MLVSLKRFVTLSLLAGSAALLPSACASNDSSIFIRSCLATTDRVGCTFTVQTTSAEIFQGSIDAVFAGEYHCIAAVENQMDPEANPETARTETDGVQLYEAEVQVLDPSNNNAAIKQFSVPITGYIDPAMGGTPGVSGTDILMIDAATVQLLAGKVASTKMVQTVVASVIAKGRTLGGLEVHTQEFLFPIDVYAGGTCFAPPGSSCCAGTSGGTEDCRYGIDESTNCQLSCGTSACGKLECATKGDPTTAQCPVNTPPDDSCCP